MLAFASDHVNWSDAKDGENVFFGDPIKKVMKYPIKKSYKKSYKKKGL